MIRTLVKVTAVALVVRQAYRTGRIVGQVEGSLIATSTGRCSVTGLRKCPWHPDGGNHPEVTGR